MWLRRLRTATDLLMLEYFLPAELLVGLELLKALKSRDDDDESLLNAMLLGRCTVLMME